jgi:hypothetical protein
VSWGALDDRLHGHPKVRRLQRIPFAGAEAFGIWCWCISWCRAYAPLTGRVSVENVAVDWGADAEHFAEVFALLAMVGLVDPVEGDPDGYDIHDWDDWQLSPEQRGGKIASAKAERTAGGQFAKPEHRLPPAIGTAGAAGDSRSDSRSTGWSPPHPAPPIPASPRQPARETARPTEGRPSASEGPTAIGDLLPTPPNLPSDEEAARLWAATQEALPPFLTKPKDATK